jgi:hypothetical protein
LLASVRSGEARQTYYLGVAIHQWRGEIHFKAGWCAGKDRVDLCGSLRSTYEQGPPPALLRPARASGRFVVDVPGFILLDDDESRAD